MTASSNKANANAETAQSSSQTGAAQGGTQTDSSAGYRSSGAEVTSDIGQAEAYIAQIKRLVAGEIDHTANLQLVAVQALQAAVSRDNLAQSNAVTLANRVNNLSVDHDGRVRAFQEGEVSRTVRAGDLATDRMWNIDEVAALVARSSVFQDAIAGAVAAGVAGAISNKE